MRLDELKGLPEEVVETLEAAGLRSLRDILDLERDDVMKIEGMTPERTNVLLAFLSELTDENPDVEGEGQLEADSGGASQSGDSAESPPAA